MLLPLLRASPASSRVCKLLKPYLSRQNKLPFFSSSYSFSSKKMMGDRTTDLNPSRRGSRYGRGSVSVGKSSIYKEGGSSASPSLGRTDKSPQTFRPQQRDTSPEKITGNSSSRGFEGAHSAFDICMTESIAVVRLQKSLLEVNREKRKVLQRSKDVLQHKYLRSGMILLKNYIEHHNQVRIVENCRKLGVGSGGFYQPGYRDGAKLHLQMMCLGKNWDPESRLYEDSRPFDGAVPPKIPEEFRKLVDSALQASHDFLRQTSRGVNVVEKLSLMSPDICIVNFYSNNGRLGLHQDRDESKESLERGLPVVSFSLGDSAEFLYGVERDVDKAEKVVLESGDVLVFGGESRLIFHGVSSIIPNTAPKRLMAETKLRPGRLNLTFRQY